MRCPYCAEEIKDEAILCRYCGHDLYFFKPLLEKISSLEKKISEMSDSLESLRSGTQTPAVSATSGAQDNLTFTQRVLAVVLPAWIMTVSYVLYYLLVLKKLSPDEVTEIAENYFFGWYPHWTDVLLLGAPVVAGAWVGMKLRGPHLKTYTLLGALVGVLVAAGITASDTTVTHPPFRTYFDDILDLSFLNDSSEISVFIKKYLIDFVGLYMVISTTLFVSGGLFGDIIERRRSNRSVLDDAGMSKDIAKNLVSTNSPLYEKTVKLLTIIYPSTLLFLGTILTLLYGKK